MWPLALPNCVLHEFVLSVFSRHFQVCQQQPLVKLCFPQAAPNQLPVCLFFISKNPIQFKMFQCTWKHDLAKVFRNNGAANKNIFWTNVNGVKNYLKRPTENNMKLLNIYTVYDLCLVEGGEHPRVLILSIHFFFPCEWLLTHLRFLLFKEQFMKLNEIQCHTFQA